MSAPVTTTLPVFRLQPVVVGADLPVGQLSVATSSSTSPRSYMERSNRSLVRLTDGVATRASMSALALSRSGWLALVAMNVPLASSPVTVVLAPMNRTMPASAERDELPQSLGRWPARVVHEEAEPPRARRRRPGTGS